MDSPQGRINFVKLSHWNAVVGDWVPWHGGLSLVNPAAYVKKVYENNGLVIRAVDLDTGEIHYGIEGADLL